MAPIVEKLVERTSAFLVAGWYHMIGKGMAIAPCFGLHASLYHLLVAHPVWAMINGESRTGSRL